MSSMSRSIETDAIILKEGNIEGIFRLNLGSVVVVQAIRCSVTDEWNWKLTVTVITIASPRQLEEASHDGVGVRKLALNYLFCACHHFTWSTHHTPLLFRPMRHCRHHQQRLMPTVTNPPPWTLPLTVSTTIPSYSSLWHNMSRQPLFTVSATQKILFLLTPYIFLGAPIIVTSLW